MRMGGFLSGIVGALGALTKGVIPKLLIASPVVLWDFTLVEDATPVVALVVIIFADWILGLVRAVAQKNLSSKALTSGVGKMFAYLLLIIVVNQAAVASSMLYWLPWLTYAYISLTEVVSIIENLNDLGVHLPLSKFIYKFLSRDTLGDPKKALIEVIFEEYKEKLETKASSKKQTQKIRKLDSVKLTMLVTRLQEELKHRENGDAEDS